MPVSRQQAALISARSLLTQQDVRLVELLKEWDENEDGTGARLPTCAPPDTRARRPRYQSNRPSRRAQSIGRSSA
eukprot:840469-Prymnesium_polylepis.1